MSNNTPDYENNLAFAPTSADDLNEQHRQSDVLVSALEKCEKLEKQLKIAVEALEIYAEEKSWRDLEECDVVYFDVIFKSCGYKPAQKALKQIKELNNDKAN